MCAKVFLPIAAIVFDSTTLFHCHLPPLWSRIWWRRRLAGGVSSAYADTKIRRRDAGATKFDRL